MSPSRLLPYLPYLFLPLLLLACDEDTSAPSTAPEPPEAPDDDATFTWYRDIAPMLDRHCGSCHLPGGQGAGDFTDATLVQAFVPAIIDSVRTGRMPPPASDPACHDYIGADRWVPPADLSDRLLQWREEGAPLGDPATAVAVEPLRMQVESPDLSVRIPQPYTPTFSDPRNPGNEYRCFVAEHGRDETFYITKMAPIIDQPELVHHIVLFKARRHDVPEHDNWDEGYDCIDMTFFVGSGGAAELINGDSGMISAWAPGSQAVEFAPNTGIRMEPDHVFILQVHYYQSNPDAVVTDHSGYEFETVERARTEVLMAPFGPTGFRIPPGEENHLEVLNLRIPLPVPLFLHGVMPHMHYLGQSYRMWFTHREEETCIVESDRYDFDNQLTYMFEEPIRIPPNAEIGFSCTWNNSPSNPNLIHNPPIEIRYGERTDEEMCYGFSLISIGR